MVGNVLNYTSADFKSGYNKNETGGMQRNTRCVCMCGMYGDRYSRLGRPVNTFIRVSSSKQQRRIIPNVFHGLLQQSEMMSTSST